MARSLDGSAGRLIRLVGIVVGLGWLGACVDATGPIDDRVRSSSVGVIQLEGAHLLTLPAWSTKTTGAAPIRWSREPGDALAPPAVIVSPAEALVDQPFQVVVHTIGTNGCWKAEGHVVHQDLRTVTITPYDVHSGAEICTAVLRYLSHIVTIVPDDTGDWTIRVSGRRARLGDSIRDDQVTAEATVTVH
jgi:hypothetical protein